MRLIVECTHVNKHTHIVYTTFFEQKIGDKGTRGNEREEERLSFNVWIKNVGRSKHVHRKAQIVSLYSEAINFHVFLSPPPRATRNFCILQCQHDLTRSRTCWYHLGANEGTHSPIGRIEIAAYKNAKKTFVPMAFPSNDSFDRLFRRILLRGIRINSRGKNIDRRRGYLIRKIKDSPVAINIDFYFFIKKKSTNESEKHWSFFINIFV